MDPKALYKISYGVYIVSAQGSDHKAGCVINTLTQVTSSPMKLSIALNKNNDTLAVIKEAGTFSAVVLKEDVDLELIKIFGFFSSRDKNKFDSISYKFDDNNNPYPAGGIVAQFTCRLCDSLDVGSHVICIGEVTDANLISEEPPLTYADYHLKKGGTTPKNAPSYQEGRTGYQCTVCGYIEETDELPDDFICPVCGKDASYFRKL
ncbi:MAG TPA: flavin reductase [Lachnoclostridium phytofermentans]|uniref:Flavin reductase n=1 Tax=Lachnoclostridium phytofermentans TaxID=66219 RepID=A0A3D2X902_9FIRM|nr:flavin reductase [Lachnoclostridium sp.]HCL03591.1 flavin reductase [Lachnoclostridium phytofermentans]